MIHKVQESTGEQSVWVRLSRLQAGLILKLLEMPSDADVAKSVETQLADYDDSRREPYLAAARTSFEREGDVEFDNDAVISMERNNEEGAYVQAWLWVERERAFHDKE